MSEPKKPFQGVRTLENLCIGCVNCIKSCPTEAIRVNHGKVRILPSLCIDCGECLRTCKKKALTMNDDDWRLLRSHRGEAFVADPSLYIQFASYRESSLVDRALRAQGMDMATEEMALAFDITAYAIARLLERSSPEGLPLISTYCPAMNRLIQARFPELIGRLVPADSPLELGARLYQEKFPEKDLCLMVPCPAKITMVYSPLGRQESSFSHAVSIKHVARDLLAAGGKGEGKGDPKAHNRWVPWAMRGGEAAHVQAFSEKPLRILAVSGLCNTLDLLQDIELGKLRGVDYIECRVCAQGCLGGVGNAESRFISELLLQDIQPQWTITEEYKELLEEHYHKGQWRMDKEIRPQSRHPLGEDLTQAMGRLKKLEALHHTLPQIDCGACGRPSCFALAEDIVRGEAEITDCIFKLRERVSSLASEIDALSRDVSRGLKQRGGEFS